MRNYHLGNFGETDENKEMGINLLDTFAPNLKQSAITAAKSGATETFKYITTTYKNEIKIATILTAALIIYSVAANTKILFFNKN